MEKNKKEFIRSRNCADIYVESSTEYALPDYSAEVRKILYTDAYARPAGKFIGEGEAEFSGIVEYNIIYSDGEGRICGATFTSDYDYSVKCSSDITEDAYADTRVANFAVRLVGPRKISAKASVQGSVVLCQRETASVSGSAFDDESSVEILNKNIMIHSGGHSALMEREYAEKLVSLDGAIADEVHVVYSGANMAIDDIEVGENSVSLNGKVKMYAVIRNGDSPAYLAHKEIEVLETVTFERADEYMSHVPCANTVSVKANINPTDTGSDVTLSAVIELGIRGEKNTPVSLVSDAYMQSCVTENIYEDFTYCEYLGMPRLFAEVNGEIDRGQVEIDNLREVVYMSATPKIDNVEIGEDGVNISGEVRFAGVVSAIQDDGKVIYSNVKMTAPFNENVNITCQNCEKIDLKPNVSLDDIIGNIDENKVRASCKISIACAAIEEKTVRRISECAAREDLPFEKTGARVVVYYPNAGETVFSVAKKFHTSVKKVASENSLTGEVMAGGQEFSLGGVKRLIIS